MPPPPELAVRTRRTQPTRLEGFVDASFAFAITLVVISIGRVPSSVGEMLTALHGIPTFAVCFVLLARLWLSHRRFSRQYDLEDTPTLVLSLALVFLVLVYVYPLRMLYAQMFLALSGGWLSDGSVTPLKSFRELRAAYVVFGAGMASISVVFALLYRHALRRADAIGLDAGETPWTRMKHCDWSEQCAVCLASITLASWLPMTGILSASAPGLVYMASAVTRPLIARHFQRRWIRLDEGVA